MTSAPDNVRPFRTAEAHPDLKGPLDGRVARHLERMNRDERRREFLARAAAVMTVGAVVALAALIGILRGAGL